MLHLKRRWLNFSPASRLLVIIAVFSVFTFNGLAVFLTSRSTVDEALVRKTLPAALAPASNPASFNYQVSQSTPLASGAALPAKSEVSRLLAVANGYLDDGKPVDAAAEYRLITASFPDSPEAVDAAFGAARASEVLNHFQEADTLYKNFLAAYPTDPRRRLALFALADSQKAQGYWDASINYYQQYLQEKDGKLLEGYAFFGIGEALDSTLKKDRAVEYYKKAGISSNGSILLRVTALERVGDYYASTGNPGAAAEWYNKILDLAKMPEYRASILLKTAKAYSAAKQDGQANTVYNIIVDQYLETASGLPALKALNNANPFATGDFQRGYLAFQSGDWVGATNAFGKVLGRTDDQALPSTTPPLAANLSKAEQDKIAKAWFWLARTYEQKGDPIRAANEFRELQLRLPQTDLAQEAAWRVALILKNGGQVDNAAAQYAYIASSYPAGRYTEEALYDQAELIFQRYGPEQAVPLAEAFAEKYPASDLRNKLLFNLSRSLAAKGNTNSARTLLQKAAASTGSDYYAFRAAEVLSGQNPVKVTRSNPQAQPSAYDPVQFAKDAATDRKVMENWLLTWAVPSAATTPLPSSPVETTTVGSTSSKPVSPTPVISRVLNNAAQNLQNDAGLKRVVELKLLGRQTQAEREAQEAIDRFSGKGAELYYLALNLNEQGMYYNSIAAARSLFDLYHSQKPTNGLRATPLLLQKFIYPLDYQNLVLEHSQRNDIDPLLLLSLIKQESSFRSDATSSVGAKGLTQVMPETGRGIAAALDKPGFNPEDLYRPALAVEFGAYYLGQSIHANQDNPFIALAAYNSGGGNANRWVAANPPDRNFDAYVENIDFAETRGYVKIIYSSYAMYRQIYAVSSEG